MLSGVVAELAAQLRREEIEQEADQAPEATSSGSCPGRGVWMVFHPIAELETHDEIGVEALARFGSIPVKPPDRWFAEATALELGLQLQLRTLKEALEALPKIPDGAFLQSSYELRRLGGMMRAVDRETALISFAGETNMTIVAEGIETAAELDTLRELGVRYGQGFYLARPARLT